MAHEKILIVEDDPAIADLIGRYLRLAGYQVSATLRSGEQALAQVAQLQPDLALMDIALSGELDGVQAAEQLHARFDVPVVFLTGLADDKTLARSREARAFGYLLKPFRQEDLKTSIELALGKHKVESKLRKVEQWFTAAIRSIADGVITTDDEANVTFLNPVAEALTGWTLDQALGRPLEEIFRVTGAAASSPVRRPPAARPVLNFPRQTVLAARGGSRLPVECCAAPIRNEEDVIGTVLVFRDITERQQAEENLARSENRLRAIIDTEPDCVKLIDAGGTVLEMNPAGLMLLEADSARQVIGQNVFELVVPADRETFRAAVQAAFTGESRSLEFDLTSLKGTRRSAESQMVPLRNKRGEVIAALGITRDVTERRRSLSALRDGEQRFHLFMNASPVLAFMKDEAGRYIYGNRAWAGQFGKEPAQMLGCTDFDLWPKDVARVFQQSDAAALAAGQPVESTESATLDDGTQRHWMIFKFPMPSADGRRLVAGLVLDVTERKQAEEELNHSREQLRSLAAHLQSIREQERTRISREIHDELGQMLTGLKMDLAWIDKRIAALPDADARTPIAGKVKSMFSLLDVMVKSVRKISAELRPGALDDLGLLPAMEWQSREWQSRTGIECHLHSTLGDLVVPPEVGTAVFRIFQESLTNVARHAQATRVDVQLQADAETIWMELKDNGRGITDEELRHSKSLGLVGMRERATMLGGDFRIEGAAGQGTSLKIRIPMPA